MFKVQEDHSVAGTQGYDGTAGVRGDDCVARFTKMTM